MRSKKPARLARVLAVLFAFALIAAACGDDDDEVGTSEDGGSADGGDMAMDDGGSADDGDMAMDDGGSAEGGDDMDMGDGMDMNMGDPDATPASEVAGAEVVEGSFVLLDTRPDGYDDVTGTAQLARHDGGTTVTTEVFGLIPGEDYISHVHAEPCADNGGPHYRFDPDGSDMPPNEIHLAFTADEEGRGFMTAENDMVAGDDAVAFVVHPVDLLDNKIACVDFG
ncbi:MAG: hypothetical protein RIE08_03840 [Acidimicrobiales bacterium]